MNNLELTYLSPNDERIFINGSEIYGVQDINLSYTYPLVKSNFLGTNIRQYIPNGAVRGDISINRVFNDKDWLFNHLSGFRACNGFVIKQQGQTGQNFAWVSGYITNYGISIRNGEPIISSYNLTTFHDCGTLGISTGSFSEDWTKSNDTIRGYSIVGKGGVSAGGNVVSCDGFNVSSIFNTGDSFYVKELSNTYSGIVIGTNSNLTGNSISSNTISGFLQRKNNFHYVPKGGINVGISGMEYEGISECNISYSYSPLPIYTLGRAEPVAVFLAEPISVEVGINVVLNKSQLGYLKNVNNASGINIAISAKNNKGSYFLNKTLTEMYLISESITAQNQQYTAVDLRFQGCIPIRRSLVAEEIIVPFSLVIDGQSLYAQYITDSQGGPIYGKSLYGQLITDAQGGPIYGKSLYSQLVKDEDASLYSLSIQPEVIEQQDAALYTNALAIESIEQQSEGPVYANSLLIEVIEQEVI